MTPFRPRSALAVVVSTCLAWSEARSQVPGGHFYAGLTVERVQPFGYSLITHVRLGGGSGGGLYFSYELRRFFVGLELASGSFAHDDTYSRPWLFALRPGVILGTGNIAPYVAAGYAGMAYGALGDDAANGTGLSSEVGLLLFRSRRSMRASVALQYNHPLHDSGTGKGNIEQLSWASFAVRMQL